MDLCKNLIFEDSESNTKGRYVYGVYDLFWSCGLIFFVEVIFDIDDTEFILFLNGVVFFCLVLRWCNGKEC